MSSSLCRRDRHDGDAESGADHFCDLPHRDAFLGDGMPSRSRPVLLQRQAIKPRHVSHVAGRPAIGAVADVGRDALGLGDLDEWRDEALLFRVMHLGEPDCRHADALLRPFLPSQFGHLARVRVVAVEAVLERGQAGAARLSPG
ncbi:hypothetical protein G6F50_015424 [Rhizopus delemar]|uniref:Uncharacterized protein n=1 Tax=Rhizopus delemar TaxID=936053 RepID=A0A9P7C4N4_9FUNG|nr:hypothetical protein G6F50_015424 [Rhizopus delemar]